MRTLAGAVRDWGQRKPRQPRMLLLSVRIRLTREWLVDQRHALTTLAGVACIDTGVALWNLNIGLIVAGLLCFGLVVVMDPKQARQLPERTENG